MPTTHQQCFGAVLANDTAQVAKVSRTHLPHRNHIVKDIAYKNIYLPLLLYSPENHDS